MDPSEAIPGLIACAARDPLCGLARACCAVGWAKARSFAPCPTELDGVDVSRVRPEGFGLPIEPSSEYVYPSQGRSSVLWGNMSKFALTCLMAILSTTGTGLGLDA